MGEKRNITEEDIFLKARILAEGICYDEDDPAKRRRGNLLLDGCALPVSAFPNAYSRLEVVWERDHAAITDKGKILGTGTLLEDWSLISIPLNSGCHNQTEGLPYKKRLNAVLINLFWIFER